MRDSEDVVSEAKQCGLQQLEKLDVFIMYFGRQMSDSLQNTSRSHLKSFTNRTWLSSDNYQLGRPRSVRLHLP